MIVLDERITPPTTGLGGIVTPELAVGSVAIWTAIGAGLGWGSARLMHARDPKKWTSNGAIIGGALTTVSLIVLNNTDFTPRPRTP